MKFLHSNHDHTCLDTTCEPVATRIGPATPPNVYGPLPSLNDWLERVLKREIPREQLDALVANGVRRPFHLATLSTSRMGACGFDGKEVSTINAVAAAALNKNKPGALLLPVRIWENNDDRMRLAEVVAECSATHVVRLSLVWHVWGRGRVEQSFPEDELCGEVSRRVAALEPWEHVKYLNCVFEKDWIYAFDAIRPVPQHWLVGLKVKTSSGKKHRLRIASSHYLSERRLGRKELGRVKIRLDPPAPKGWGLCGLDARPGATGIGGLGARWARVREARCDWSTYVASDDLAAERRRLAAAVDQRRRTSQDRENVNNVTGRVAVEQQDAMLRAIDRPVEPVRAIRAVTPSAPLLPAAAIARVASDAPVMAPARVPSVTPIHRRMARHLWPSAPPLPVAEVVATRAIPGAQQAEVVWPEVPTELPTASEGYSAQWTEA